MWKLNWLGGVLAAGLMAGCATGPKVCEAARYTVLHANVPVDELNCLTDPSFTNGRIVERHRQADGSLQCVFKDGSLLALRRLPDGHGLAACAIQADGKPVGQFELTTDYALAFFLNGQEEWLRP